MTILNIYMNKPNPETEHFEGLQLQMSFDKSIVRKCCIVMESDTKGNE